MYSYPAAGHVITEKLKIIARICSVICKGPKYRFLSRVNFEKSREEIAAALDD